MQEVLNNNKKYTKEGLEDILKKDILQNGFTTKGTLAKRLKISLSTFKEYDIDVNTIILDSGNNLGKTCKRYSSKEELEEILIAEILKQNRYLKLDELSKLTGVSSNTIWRYNIKLEEISIRSGFTSSKGYYQYWDLEARNTQINKIISFYKTLIISEGKPVSIYRLAQIMGVHESTLYKKLGDPRLIHEEVGIKYNYPNYEETRTMCERIILNNDRYTSYEQLSTSTGLPISFIRKALGRPQDLNYSLGYTYNISAFEEKVWECLLELLPEKIINRQKKFPDLVSNKGRKLSFDFWLPEYNLLIEADGSQHWDTNSKYYDKRQLELDSIKNDYCKLNNIELLRIKYITRVTMHYIHLQLKAVIRKI
jgi:hypothetical protein